MQTARGISNYTLYHVWGLWQNLDKNNKSLNNSYKRCAE